jgi:isoleucyl-tRNA synthetase
MFAETMFQGLRQESDLESVHLCDFPVCQEFDAEILIKMKLTREIVEAGLAARSEAQIKVRQPLAELKYSGKKLDEELGSIIAEEVNVKKLTNIGDGEARVELDKNLTDELKIEGMARELIRSIQSLRKKSGFEVENRIDLHFYTDSELLVKVMNSMKDIISKEVLAEKFVSGRIEDSEGSEDFDVGGEKIWIGVSRIK